METWLIGDHPATDRISHQPAIAVPHIGIDCGSLEEFLTDYKAKRKRERDAFDVERDLILPGR